MRYSDIPTRVKLLSRLILLVLWLPIYSIYPISLWLCESIVKLIDTINLYIYPQKHSDKIENLIYKLTNDGDRISAAQLLSTMGGTSRAIPYLLPLLEHSNPEVRVHVVKTLGYMRRAAKHTLPQILALLKDPNSKVRYSAVKALGDMGELSKSEVPTLIPLLQDSEPMVRMQTIHTLGYRKDSASTIIPELIPLLTGADLGDRAYAKAALYMLGYKEPVS